MFPKRLRRLLCLLGRHHRSKSHARSTEKGIISFCRHCGVPMRRGAGRKWVVDRRG